MLILSLRKKLGAIVIYTAILLAGMGAYATTDSPVADFHDVASTLSVRRQTVTMLQGRAIGPYRALSDSSLAPTDSVPWVSPEFLPSSEQAIAKVAIGPMISVSVGTAASTTTTASQTAVSAALMMLLMDDDPTITGISPLTGIAGTTTVTITGYDFSAVASENLITFSGMTTPVPASTVVTTATGMQLTVLVPVNAPVATGPIIVTVSGTPTTSLDNFTVQAPCTGMGITSTPTNLQFGASGSTSATTVTVSAPAGCSWTVSAVGTVQTFAGLNGRNGLTTVAMPNGAVTLAPTSGTGSSSFSLQIASNTSKSVLTASVSVADNSPAPAANKVQPSSISLLQYTPYPIPPGLVSVPSSSGALVDVAVTISDYNAWGGQLDHYRILREASTAGPWLVVNQSLPGPQMFSPYSGRVEYVDQVAGGGTFYYGALACTTTNVCSDPTYGGNTTASVVAVAISQPTLTVKASISGSTASSMTTVTGGSTAPEQLYTVRLRPNSSLTPLGENAFGEQIEPSTGSLSFLQRDISLSGVGPDIEIYRSFDVTRVNQELGGAFFDWNLELPRITANVTDATGVTPGTGTAGGQWTVGANHSTNRCSAFGVDMSSPAGLWFTDGVQLVIPGQGAQEVLLRSANNSIQPVSGSSFSGVTSFPLVTTGHWQIGCLSTTSNGQPGEAFLAVSPEGTQYWFDNLVYDMAGQVSSVRYDGSSVYVNRYHASMLVTKIRDRFGNTLHFSYGSSWLALWNAYNDYSTRNLVEVSADDGRDVKISYNSERGYPSTVSTITVQQASQTPRTWIYNYSRAQLFGSSLGSSYFLQSVVLPDSSAWNFNLVNFEDICDLVRMDVYPTGVSPWEKGCVPYGQLDTTSFVGTITAPSGLKGSFSVQKLMHSHYGGGANGGAGGCVPYSAAGFSDQSMWYAYIACNKASTQQHFITPSLMTKSYSGSGISSPLTWSYSYTPSQPALSGWAADRSRVWVNSSQLDPLNRRYDGSGNPYPSYTLSSAVTTTVTNPDSTTVVSTYDNQWNTPTDGDLLAVQRYDNSHNLLSQISYQYAPASNGPYPAQIGTDPFYLQVNSAKLQVLHPLRQTVLTQSGDTYSWIANTFDNYGRPAGVTRSGPTGAINESTVFYNDTSHWVIGQLQSVTNTDTSEVERSNAYNASTTTTTNLLSSRASFGNSLISYAWNADGTLASFTDGNNHSTTLSNYKLGTPQKVTFPDYVGGVHPTITAVVDDLGQVTSVTDQNGATTNYGYDAMGRVSQITYPTGDSNAWNATNTNYTMSTDAGGNLYWQRTETRGAMEKVTTYDARWQPTLTVTLDSNNPSNTATTVSQSMAYNWRGDVTFKSYPQNGSNGGSTGNWTDYDGLGRVTGQRQSSELGQLTTTTQYLSGATRRVTDPNGNVTTASYLAYDKPDYSLPLTISSPEGVSQIISRDPYGNPWSITQSGNSPSVSVTRSYAYDSYKRLCRLDDPEIQSEFRVYDAANNLIGSAQGQSATSCVSNAASLPSSALVTRTYDEMNRVKSIVYPSGTSNTYYTYDGRGGVLTANSGIANWTYSYTKLGPLQSETLSQSGSTYALGYNYDNNANLSQITYPDGTALIYSPDVLGRPTQAGGYASNVQYFADGKMSSYTLANGVQYTAQENSRQILQSLKYMAGSSAVFNESFSYDKNANLKQATDSVDSRRSKTMTYDGLDRLKSITAGWGNESYTYNGVNNLLSMNGTVSGQSESLTYNYDGFNRLSSVTGTISINYTYDGRGNVQTRGSATLTFDVANRLTSYSDGAIQSSYIYDAQGRRTRLNSATLNPLGAPTYSGAMVYSQSGRLMYQADDKYGLYDFVYLNGQLIAETITSAAGAQTLYRHVDHLGSPVLTSFADGTFASNGSTEYKPYGLKVYGGDVLGPGFTGHFNDIDTQLTYMQARYYDPITTRFISVDPSRIKAGFNLYAYVGNNPLNKTDPTGLAKCGTLTGEQCDTAMTDMSNAKAVADKVTSAIKGIVNKMTSGEKLSSGEQKLVSAIGEKFGSSFTSTKGLTRFSSKLGEISNKIGDPGKGIVLNRGDDKPIDGSVPAAYAPVSGLFKQTGNEVDFNASYFNLSGGDDMRQEYSIHETSHAIGIPGEAYNKGGIESIRNDEKALWNNADTYACALYPTSCGY